MPRSVPAGITAKQNNTPGAGVSFLWLWLVEIHFSAGSTVYYSSGQAASFGGNTYVANKVTELSGLTAQYIDRKRRDFGSVTITLDNLAEGGSSAFPVTVLEGSLDPAEARVFVHLFDAFSGAGVDAIWQGYVKDRQYDSENYTVTVNASFLWDSPGIVIPSSTLQQNGFSELDSNSNKENLAGDTALPLYWGAGPIKIRPTIWHTRVRDSEIQINGIISGTGPTPFNVGDITADAMKLFDITKASRVDFRIGATFDTAPPDRTAFPDGLAHNNVAHFSARFPITDANKDKTDNISAADVRMTIANGRPLISTGLPSGNGILIMQDGLRDFRVGLGMDGADFDDLTASAAACGSRWQCRIEMHDQVSVGDWVQNLCAQIHGFVTFNGRKCQLGLKLPTETPIATFATLKSGQSGRRVNGKVRQWLEAADQAKNQVNVKYRLTNRHEKELIAYDGNAQGRAGGTIRKVEKDDVTFNALYQAAPDPVGGPYGQVAIAAATIVREEQNLDLFIEVKAPLAESLDVAPGDLIRVWSENISHNGTNNVFRIIAQTFEGGADPQSVMTCQVYFGVVYNYGVGGIGIDLIRGGSDISTTGRPPDVENVAVTLIEKVTHDTEGSEAHIRGSWTWPVVDLAGDAAAGVVREYPIKSVLTKWRFTDEGANEWKPGKETAYPSTFGDFNVPYLKSKTVQVEFVALGLNGSQGVDGYVADPTKTVLLEGDWGSTAPAFFCSSPAGIIAAGDYIKTEFEINHVISATDFGGGHGQINVDPNSSPRTAFFDTVPIAHPSGTQVAKAKQNYPVASLSLTPVRFGYQAVSAIALHQRKLAVKVVITDVSPDNLETYLTYWTTNAAFATDPTKLGSTNPAWCLANPLAPPAGINLVVGKVLHFEIPQEQIGAAGIPIYARTLARNGKNNYSGDGSGNPQLSPLANNAAGDDALAVPNTPKLITKAKGVRVKNPLPTLNVKTLTDIAVVIEAGNGGSVLGYLSDTTGLGDWESGATEFRFHQGLQTAHLYCQKSDALTLWPTVSTLKIRTFLTNDVGVSLASPDATLTVATWSSEVTEDTAAASAVQGLDLEWGAKKKGFKSTWQRPATNIKSLKGYKVSYSDNAGANFMNPKTGALASPNTEVGATVFVTDQVHTTNLERSQLASQFAAGVKVKVTPVNIVLGVETDGTPATSSFVPPSGEDAAAAGAVVSLTLVWSNKKGWKATWQRPASNVLSLQGYKVVFFDNAGTNFMNPVTGALNSPNTEVGATLFVHDESYPTLLKYVQLATQFQAGAKVKVTPVTLLQGVETDGTSATSSLTPPTADDPIGTDTKVPGGIGATLSAPTCSFEDGKLVIDFSVTGLTFMATHLYNSIRIATITESSFLDIPTKTLVASGSTTKYQVHKSGHIVVGIKLRKLRDLFGNVHIAIRYFITNSVGETQSAIADVNLASLTDLLSETSLEAGTQIPAKTLALNTVNVSPGGAFISSKDAYDGLGDSNTVGSEWRDKPNRSAGVRIDTTGTRGLKWVKATHWIEIATNVFSLGGELCCWIPIRPFLPGDSWAEGISLKTFSGSYTLNAFTMSLYDEGLAADILGTPVTINTAAGIVLTTTYQVIGAVFTVSDSYVPGTSPRRQWLRLKFGENPPVALHADNNMINRGSQILPWGPALEDRGVASDIDPSGSTGSGSAGSGGGGGNGSGGGAGGGGVGGGGGGRIVL